MYFDVDASRVARYDRSVDEKEVAKKMTDGYVVRIAKENGRATARCDALDVTIDAPTAKEALEGIRNQIEKNLEALARERKDPPKEEYDVEGVEAFVLSFDFESIRKKHGSETVRKTISLPSWMDEALRDARIDASGLFQRAAAAALEEERGKRMIRSVEDLEAQVDESVLREYVGKRLGKMLKEGLA